MDEYIYLERRLWGVGPDGTEQFYVELYGPATATKPEDGIIAGFAIEIAADGTNKLYVFNPLGASGSKWVEV